jgi:transposase, IS5 family
MLSMITPRIKPSVFFQDQPDTDLLVQAHRQAKLSSYVANLAAMDGLIDFGAVAQSVDTECPRADRSKAGRPPYATEVMVSWSNEFAQTDRWKSPG